MKKHPVLRAVLPAILALVLCAGCSKPSETADRSAENAPAAAAPSGSVQPAETAVPASRRNAELDAAFASGETLRLTPVDMPAASPGEDWMAVDLSPDGKTVLWRHKGKEESSLCLTRGEEKIPVAFNDALGVGDPYGKAPLFSSLFFGYAPGYEGFSWSEDGRLVTFSSAKAATDKMKSPDINMIDTETGDLYLADTYMDFREAVKSENAGSSNYGITLLNRIDRSGRYCYYLRLVSGGYALCRCPVAGGPPEVLHVSADNSFSPCSYSMLWETADGSWLLTGINGKASGRNLRYTVVRFSPSGNGWKAESVPLPVVYGKWAINSASRSAASGYGLINFRYALAGSVSSNALTSGDTVQDTETAGRLEVLSSLLRHVGLMRFLPGEDPKYDIWYLQKTGGDGPGVELLPAEEFLWLFHRNYNETPTLFETVEMMKWVPEDPDAYLPDGYTPEDAMADLRGEKLLNIACAVISPDGYYALINAGAKDWEDPPLYLVSLDTMQIRPVSAPAGVGGFYLQSGSMTSDFPPLIRWNEDGTLLILDQTEENRMTTHTYRLEFGQ